MLFHNHTSRPRWPSGQVLATGLISSDNGFGLKPCSDLGLPETLALHQYCVVDTTPLDLNSTFEESDERCSIKDALEWTRYYS
ncbi:hypothetical protein AVEN_194395-1 [Araneus ventricosus]|uniref:Uncharacterized protein n=1 Tax=Araneus ventricosus TaxID=182803 RepID=A0A4Y2A5J9_ARAVE|nr:hypothetical protein AVEN_194395-1 [Araneus ventricosus]